MSQLPVDWHAIALNRGADCGNEIHSDEMARAFGFERALVPGVCISAYLMHPAAEAWGEQWLESGRANIVVRRPLYDGDAFDVIVCEATERSYSATLVDQDGTRCASGMFEMGEPGEPAPVRRGDPLLQHGGIRPPVSREVLERFRDEGMNALVLRWSRSHELASYLSDAALMPLVHRADGRGLANGAFLLALSNWVLAGNTSMNPSVHVQTDSRFYAAVEPDTDLVSECAVVDLFERKGHEFVDAKVDTYVCDTNLPVMSTMLRVIYRLRASGSGR